MTIPLTRLPTPSLRPVVEHAARDLDRLDQVLGELVPILTENERKTTPRTREGFEQAARVFADLLRTRPEIALITDYDGDAVLEDLDNVALVDVLLPRLEGLLQRLTDARLRWLAEAQEPTLAAYGVAKTRSQRDGTLAAMIEPLRQVLANPRSKR